MPLSLDWMNLFGGLSSGQVTSVFVVAVIFTAASGLTLLSLIAFGVRAGLMAPAYSTRVPLVGLPEPLGVAGSAPSGWANRRTPTSATPFCFTIFFVRPIHWLSETSLGSSIRAPM